MQFGGILAVVEILSAHLSIFRDPLLSCFPTDQRASHSTGDYTAGSQQDCCGKDDPSSPLQVRDEE